MDSEPLDLTRLRVTNITASATLMKPLDLRTLARNMYDVEYDTRKFSALVHRLRSPKATCMVSTNGYIICIGTHTVEDAKHALKKVKYHIAKASQESVSDYKLHEFKVHNMAAHFSYGHALQIQTLGHFYPQDSCYDPIVFSGLRFKNLGDAKRIKAVIFHSGNLILTGAKDRKSLKRAMRQLDTKIRLATLQNSPL